MFLTIVTKERLTQALSSLWQKILELLPNIVYNKELNSFIIGGKSKVQGANAVAMGLNCEANGKQSVAIGTETKAAGNHSFASGYQTEASKPYDHVEGYKSIAQGKASHAEGGGSVAGYSGSYNTLTENEDTTGAYSHAEGNASAAAGCAAHAEGKKTYANGIAAHAEGAFTRAVGTAAHAEGSSTVASGSFSHAEGSHTEAIGRDSHAEGAYNKAIGIASHAEGEHNIAKNQAQHVSGKYATIDESGEAIFQVGIGKSDAERKDALRVTDDGRIFFRKEDEEVLLQEQLDSLHNSLGEKADKSNLNRLEQEINTFETNTGRVVQSLNNSVETLNNDVGTLQNDVGTLQERQAGNDQEIANLQSELSSRVTQKQLDDAIGNKADTTLVNDTIGALADTFDGKLLLKADKSNLNQLEQEFNTFETKTASAITSLNNSVKTLNNDVGTLQERQAGNDQEIANLQSELSSRVTQKQLDEALSELSGSVVGGTSNVINDVSLFAMAKSKTACDYVFLKAPAGMIKETDKVIFARYIKNKTRPRVNGATDKTKYRTIYKGWIRPRVFNIFQQYPLWIDDNLLVLSPYRLNNGGYDYFYIEATSGDDLIEYLYVSSYASLGEKYPKVVNKKLGIKIVRDGKTIVDYLPFTIQCNNNVPRFSRI